MKEGRQLTRYTTVRWFACWESDVARGEEQCSDETQALLRRDRWHVQYPALTVWVEGRLVEVW